MKCKHDVNTFSCSLLGQLSACLLFQSTPCVWQQVCMPQSEGMIVAHCHHPAGKGVSNTRRDCASDADVLEAIISQGAVKRDAVRAALTASAADPAA